ncbi:HNH endonuclease [Aliiroseovarius sp. 2305UL8-7]|uniref:HNH endonuclease n=1 Tax=Aliiroseovarius conchicola TaxID=3121637 RepID=UPI0035284207
MQALERDEWACVKCGRQDRLECDHIKPVRTHPELSYSLDNLQMLCGTCHARKTRIEVGHKPLSKPRQEWRDFVRDMRISQATKGNSNA